MDLRISVAGIGMPRGKLAYLARGLVLTGRWPVVATEGKAFDDGK